MLSAKIVHVAIVSHNFPRLQKFYECLGMKGTDADRSRPFGQEGREGPLDQRSGAARLSDGYVGMNLIGREAGFQGGLDHFGIDVNDLDLALARIRERYPTVGVVKRPSNRPFASFSAHDPGGNVFDLSQTGMENRSGLYGGSGWQQSRRVHHIQTRVWDPALVASFYRDVFELREEEKALEDPNFYLTDGVVTLVIAPWKISDYAGTSPVRPGLDHIGFKVESLQAVKQELAALGLPGESNQAIDRDRDNWTKADPARAGRALDWVSERDAILRLFATCRYGDYHLSDPDGVLTDVSEG